MILRHESSFVFLFVMVIWISSTMMTMITANTTSMTWEQRASYPGNERHHPITFANETHAFLLTGSTYTASATKDFYMYDEAQDTWTDLTLSMSAFPGLARSFGYGVVVMNDDDDDDSSLSNNDNKAYLGFGQSASGTVLNDLWEFNMQTHEWRQLANLPGTGRRHPAMVATTDGLLHVGLGDNRRRNLQDWYTYDTNTHVWTQREDFPSTARHHPFFFGLGLNAYAGLGHATGYPVRVERDWYRYSNNNNDNNEGGGWRSEPDFASYETTDTNETIVSTTEGRVAGTEFSIQHSNGKSLGFVLSGDGDDHSSMATGEFHAFSPETGTWQILEPHPGISRWAPGSFVMKGTTRAYFTSGYDRMNGILYNDLWRIDLAPLFLDDDDTDTDTGDDASSPTPVPIPTVDIGGGMCFAGSSMVQEKTRGTIPMSELRMGDQVQTLSTDSSSSSSWSKIRTFLHWHPTEVVSAVVITHTKGKNLTLTPNHLLFVQEKDKGENSLRLAGGIQVGDLLVTTTNNNNNHHRHDDSSSTSTVLAIEATKMEGYYAPLTTSGTILVDGVLASCYANYYYYHHHHHHDKKKEENTLLLSLDKIPHWILQSLLTPLRYEWSSFFGRRTIMPPEGEIHPYAQWLLRWYERFHLVGLAMTRIF